MKFATMLVDRSLAESARLAAHHGADAIGVTGSETGDPPTASTIEQAKSGAGACPVLVGSGLDVTNAATLMAAADGAIVGTSVKTGERVDAAKVSEWSKPLAGPQQQQQRAGRVPDRVRFGEMVADKPRRYCGVPCCRSWPAASLWTTPYCSTIAWFAMQRGATSSTPESVQSWQA